MDRSSIRLYLTVPPALLSRLAIFRSGAFSSAIGAAALSVLAAVAVTLGLWPRLSEYR